MIIYRKDRIPVLTGFNTKAVACEECKGPLSKLPGKGRSRALRAGLGRRCPTCILKEAVSNYLDSTNQTVHNKPNDSNGVSNEGLSIDRIVDPRRL